MEHTVQSKKTLLKATAFAAVLAVIVFFVAILPAEFGTDPTGLGKMMRLTQLSGQTSTAQAATTQVASTKPTLSDQEDSVDISIPAGKGLEYKFYLVGGDAMRYGWSTKGGELLYFDFHGEPQGDTTGYFESYTISTANNVRGSFTASFEGSHGWYWKNKGHTDIVVTLQTEGSYKIIGLK
ncbi:MAG: hypothetical protein HOI59_05260 [Nitrospina sp.]|nr:hypothetical protein [Nitrospina sp.]MBT3857522.1 hypothetical protein [Nitrospina sp.]MBT4388534.1 hypothetical protein [Nitrospina sp.]MBT4622030.1 hypothetical protein [Nitrospina sp.]MBT5259283.1 hypothetical protein [Nitrospina sp.]